MIQMVIIGFKENVLRLTFVFSKLFLAHPPAKTYHHTYIDLQLFVVTVLTVSSNLTACREVLL